MAETVPIYVQAKGNGQFYRYGTQLTGDPGWDQSKNIQFYAYSTPQEGTVPFYRHRVGTTDRYQLDTDPSAHDGWSGGEDPFHVYPSNQPRTGAIPVYSHSTPNGDKTFYNTRLAGGSGWNAGLLAFYGLPNLDGYGVGDKAAEIVGHDQSDKPVQLSKYSPGNGWILVDVCAQWCGPCQFAAQKTRAFIDSVNSQKLKLKPFTVLVDGRDYKASTLVAAQQWATKYNFDAKEAVVHCGGNAQSDLRWLVNWYAFANDNPQPAYPTYVIIDEDNTIRYFQQGFDLDNLQRELAVASGIALTGGPWIGLA